MRQKGFSISVLKLPSGRWFASIETLSPKPGVMAVPGPGQGEPVPGDFDSENAAVEVAKLHIECERGDDSRGPQPRRGMRGTNSQLLEPRGDGGR
jgi:hypothetical protein